MRLPTSPWDLLFLAAFMAYCWIRHIHEQRAKTASVAERRVDAAELGLMALAFVGTLLLPVLHLFSRVLTAADRGQHWTVGAAGAVLAAAALLLFHRSHADLGTNWSVTLTIRSEHALIEHGVYRRIRHPMYAAILLFGAGQSLLLANWIAGPAAVIAFLPLYLVRVPKEEAMMRDRFGAEYDAYVGRTGRLLPKP